MSKIASGIVLFSLLMALSLGVAFADAGMSANNSTVNENNTNVTITGSNTSVIITGNNTTVNIAGNNTTSVMPLNNSSA
jgi:hypothetical protein